MEKMVNKYTKGNKYFSVRDKVQILSELNRPNEIPIKNIKKIIAAFTLSFLF
jgi:hypothetical protein